MAAKGKAGRPVDGYPLVIFNMSIGLHPVRHAHIIAILNAAPKGKRSSVVVDLMMNGSTLPAQQPTTVEAPAVVKLDVSDDGF